MDNEELKAFRKVVIDTYKEKLNSKSAEYFWDLFFRAGLVNTDDLIFPEIYSFEKMELKFKFKEGCILSSTNWYTLLEGGLLGTTLISDSLLFIFGSKF